MGKVECYINGRPVTPEEFDEFNRRMGLDGIGVFQGFNYPQAEVHPTNGVEDVVSDQRLRDFLERFGGGPEGVAGFLGLIRENFERTREFADTRKAIDIIRRLKEKGYMHDVIPIDQLMADYERTRDFGAGGASFLSDISRCDYKEPEVTIDLRKDPKDPEHYIPR